MNRFHQFQLENQKKLSQYIQTQTNLLATTVSPCSRSSSGADRALRVSSEAVNPPVKVLLVPRPPSFNSPGVSNKFRRRCEEKAFLKAKNMPLYDYDPEDLEEEGRFGLSLGEGCEDEREDEGGDEYIDIAIDQTGRAGENRKKSSIAPMTSRQVSMHLRRKSSHRQTIRGDPRQTSRRTDLRQTLLELFKARAEKAGNPHDSMCTVVTAAVLDKKKVLDRDNDKTRYVLKPNGPISKDVVWRERALMSGGLRYSADDKYRNEA